MKQVGNHINTQIEYRVGIVYGKLRNKLRDQVYYKIHDKIFQQVYLEVKRNIL